MINGISLLHSTALDQILQQQKSKSKFWTIFAFVP